MRKYSFKKKSNNQENPNLPELTANHVIESIMTNDIYPANGEPISYATDEDDLIKLFD